MEVEPCITPTLRLFNPLNMRLSLPPIHNPLSPSVVCTLSNSSLVAPSGLYSTPISSLRRLDLAISRSLRSIQRLSRRSVWSLFNTYLVAPSAGSRDFSKNSGIKATTMESGRVIHKLLKRKLQSQSRYLAPVDIMDRESQNIPFCCATTKFARLPGYCLTQCFIDMRSQKPFKYPTTKSPSTTPQSPNPENPPQNLAK